MSVHPFGSCVWSHIDGVHSRTSHVCLWGYLFGRCIRSHIGCVQSRSSYFCSSVHPLGVCIQFSFSCVKSLHVCSSVDLASILVTHYYISPPRRLYRQPPSLTSIHLVGCTVSHLLLYVPISLAAPSLTHPHTTLPISNCINTIDQVHLSVHSLLSIHIYTLKQTTIYPPSGGSLVNNCTMLTCWPMSAGPSLTPIMSHPLDHHSR